VTDRSRELEVLDGFGKMLVAEVYDATCGELQRMLYREEYGVPRDNPVGKAYRSLDPETARLVRRLVISGIKQCFARFLFFLDAHNEIPMVVTTQSGDEVDIRKVSDGLHGEPCTEKGWLARFSEFKDGLPEQEKSCDNGYRGIKKVGIFRVEKDGTLRPDG
jgi:hypothetical protein